MKYIKKVDPNVVIFNTSENKNPDVVREAYQLYKDHNAEAVFIISNPKGTRKVVYDLKC